MVSLAESEVAGIKGRLERVDMTTLKADYEKDEDITAQSKRSLPVR